MTSKGLIPTGLDTDTQREDTPAKRVNGNANTVGATSDPAKRLDRFEKGGRNGKSGV